jgi:hypothetical protein
VIPFFFFCWSFPLFHYGKHLSVTQGELIGRVFRAALSIQKEKRAAHYYDMIHTPEK